MSTPAAAAPSESSAHSKPRLQWLATPWRAFFAVILTQGPVICVLLLGYLYRLMRRQALRYWWRHAGERWESFEGFLNADATMREHVTLPNWFIAPERQRAEREDGALRALPRLLTASLWQNLRKGVVALLTLWTVTLPGCALMLFAWYDGWNNSFNKGYENAPVGPLAGILGLVLFSAAAAYVPMAQARHAACDEWRVFFDVRTNLKLLRSRTLAALVLTAGYLAASVPVTLIYTLPGFLPQMEFMSERYATMSNAEALAYINGWYFWGGALFVALLVALKRAGAHLYAGALLRCVDRGAVRFESLSKFERDVLARLGRPGVDASASTRQSRGILVFLVLVLPWLVFTTEIFVAQFFSYHGGHGWLNQPLLQLPWMNYVPEALRELATP
ncbi:MAG: hypothetical protein O7G84_06415 [Gammaproteobacteria bacterium]|nr:hypothetical protein [Gammaproteobacteria bacterium]